MVFLLPVDHFGSLGIIISESSSGASLSWPVMVKSTDLEVETCPHPITGAPLG